MMANRERKVNQSLLDTRFLGYEGPKNILRVCERLKLLIDFKLSFY